MKNRTNHTALWWWTRTHVFL